MLFQHSGRQWVTQVGRGQNRPKPIADYRGLKFETDWSHAALNGGRVHHNGVAEYLMI